MASTDVDTITKAISSASPFESEKKKLSREKQFAAFLKQNACSMKPSDSIADSTVHLTNSPLTLLEQVLVGHKSISALFPSPSDGFSGRPPLPATVIEVTVRDDIFQEFLLNWRECSRFAFSVWGILPPAPRSTAAGMQTSSPPTPWAKLPTTKELARVSPQHLLCLPPGHPALRSLTLENISGIAVCWYKLNYVPLATVYISPQHWHCFPTYDRCPTHVYLLNTSSSRKGTEPARQLNRVSFVDDDSVWQEFQDVMGNPNIAKISFDIQSSLRILRAMGVEIE